MTRHGERGEHVERNNNCVDDLVTLTTKASSVKKREKKENVETW